MRIAIVRRFCSLKKAGAERYCVNLFRGLQRLGHHVTIVGEGIDAELRHEVDFHPVPVLKLNSWTKNRSFAFNTAQVVRSQSFDIVHGLSRVEGLDTYRLTDPLQTHWVKVWYRHPVSRWIQQLNPRHTAIFDLERRLFHPGGVRRVIVQSRLDAQLLREYFRVDESRIRHVVNGVDTSVFNPSTRSTGGLIHDELKELFAKISPATLQGRATSFTTQSGDILRAIAFDDAFGMALNIETEARAPLIVFASMDFRRKGLDSLLSAVAKLRNRETRLLVLGDGDIATYERMAMSLGVRQRVLFAGRQSSIQRFYGAADLFVLPTIYEPFPNVNLEAMACGTPVITTATAGGADIIVEGTNGYLIPDAWSIDALAARIDEHLELPANKKQQMSESCWQTASQLRVEENARQVAQIFEEVLREKHAA